MTTVRFDDKSRMKSPLTTQGVRPIAECRGCNEAVAAGLAKSLEDKGARVTRNGAVLSFRAGWVSPEFSSFLGGVHAGELRVGDREVAYGLRFSVVQIPRIVFLLVVAAVTTGWPESPLGWIALTVAWLLYMSLWRLYDVARFKRWLSSTAGDTIRNAPNR
jgi:hypothetical protein